MFALWLLVQVATADTVATCRVADDPQQRVWSLERLPSSWRIAFSARALDRPRVKERDLDPAVESMNTDGPLAVQCTIAEPSDHKRRTAVEPSAGSATEWIVAAGLARSVRLFESTAGRAYAVQTVGWSRELTGDLTVAGIRGRFAWGIEATPLFAQLSPTNIYGLGIAPVVWRWNLPPQPTWSAFAELSMGGLWTNHQLPEHTSRLNFTAHWGGGIRRRWRGNDSLLLAYRFQHFSNGNQLGSNPGVNSHVLLAGWSHRS